MQTIHLTFPQRVTLWNTVGNYQAPNVQAANVFHRVLEKIRPTDRERTDLRFMVNPQGYSWETKPGYGDRSIDFEGDECDAVAQVIAMSPVRVFDYEWIRPLMETLKPKQESVAA